MTYSKAIIGVGIIWIIVMAADHQHLNPANIVLLGMFAGAFNECRKRMSRRFK